MSGKSMPRSLRTQSCKRTFDAGTKDEPWMMCNLGGRLKKRCTKPIWAIAQSLAPRNFPCLRRCALLFLSHPIASSQACLRRLAHSPLGRPMVVAAAIFSMSFSSQPIPKLLLMGQSLPRTTASMLLHGLAAHDCYYTFQRCQAAVQWGSYTDLRITRTSMNKHSLQSRYKNKTQVKLQQI